MGSHGRERRQRHASCRHLDTASTSADGSGGTAATPALPSPCPPTPAPRQNIDTDQIIPAEYLTLVPSKPDEYEKLGSYALCGLPDDLYPTRYVEVRLGGRARALVEAGSGCGPVPQQPHRLQLGCTPAASRCADPNLRLPNLPAPHRRHPRACPLQVDSMKTEYPVIIGGQNFGCGSSREHAPVALGASGATVVVAESYARIFFRNCVSTCVGTGGGWVLDWVMDWLCSWASVGAAHGARWHDPPHPTSPISTCPNPCPSRSGELYPVETDERLCDVLATGGEVEVDMEADVLTDLATGKKYSLKPLGDVRRGGCPGACRGLPMLPPLALPAAAHARPSLRLSALQAGPVIDAGGIFEFARKSGMIKAAPQAK